jgi:uncharacterized protein YndB with AHSA1/START domain
MAKGAEVIEVESSVVIKTSRETVWRHLTRLSDWYRWYPGLHGVSSGESITGTGQSWRSTGQMGRMLYRGQQNVTAYRLLEMIEMSGSRRPWLASIVTWIELEPEGPNCRLTVRMDATPGFWIPGRILLKPILRRRLEREVRETASRLASYVERTMPYH